MYLEVPETGKNRETGGREPEGGAYRGTYEVRLAQEGVLGKIYNNRVLPAMFVAATAIAGLGTVGRLDRGGYVYAQQKTQQKKEDPGTAALRREYGEYVERWKKAVRAWGDGAAGESFKQTR